MKDIGTQFWNRPLVGRRMFFRHVASTVGGWFLLPSRRTERVASAAVTTKGTAKNCIFVLMAGGPSHVDTFDLKEGSWTPASFEPTSYGSLRFPRGLMPVLAEQLDSVAFVRSVRAWALVHGLAQIWTQIGRNPAAGSAAYAPHIGSVVSLELGGQDLARTLPAFVSLNVTGGPGAGYLPPENSPFYLSPGGGGMANSTHRDGAARFERRYGLLQTMDSELRTSGELGATFNETFAFNASARKLIYNSEVDRIFTFDQAERNRYGNTAFGNSCIAARNMLRARTGVRFIQMTQGSWDQHENIYAPANSHMTLARQFDNGFGTLLADLRNDGLLDETLVVAMGEFGRVPGALNPGAGRDHFVQQTVLFAGAKIRGGRAIGATDRDGRSTVDPGWSRMRDIRPEDIEATIYSALGIDYSTVRRDDPSGRGFEYVPFSDRDLYGPINELWD